MDEDLDVAEERDRLNKCEKTNDILCVRDLSKVRHVCLLKCMLNEGFLSKKFSFCLARHTREQSSLQWIESVSQCHLDRFV